MAQIFGQSLGELIDGKAGCIAGENGVFCKMRDYLLVQARFPVHSLGNCFDDKVAFLEQFQVFPVVCRLYGCGPGRAGQWRRLQLLQIFDSLAYVGIGIALVRWQFKKRVSILALTR